MIKYTHWVVIALVAIGALSIFAYKKNGVKLGLDLRGGSVITFHIPTDDIEDPEKKREVIENTVRVMRNRADRFGLAEVLIEKAGSSSIRISMPGREASEVANIRKILQRLGTLEFRIVAQDGDPIADGGTLDLAREKQIFDEDRANYVLKGERGSDYPGYKWYEEQEPDENGQKVWKLLRIDRWNFQGGDLTGLEVVPDGRTGIGFVVRFGIQDTREGDFGSFTGPNSEETLGAGQGRLMAIVLDDKIQSAPVLNDELRDGGIISGGGDGFDKPEAQELVDILLAGSLTVKPELESEYSVGPSLGEDAINKGVTAILIGFALVVVVLLYYYLLQGLIANFALMLNLLILMGVLAFLGASLTLPGLAGIVLTVGMAVDANILIYERIREEKGKGKTLLQSVKNGYDRALLTIVDANLTTVITAIILYYVGTGPVQGFAVTLIIGILASMFTALAVSRLVVEGLLAWGVLKDIRFTPLLFGERHAKYMKLRPMMIGISILLVLGGATLFLSRGEEQLDIDFTGGSEVHLRFAAPTPIAEIRETVTARYPDATIMTVKSETADEKHLDLVQESDWFTVKAKGTSDAERQALEAFLRESYAGRLQPSGAAIASVGDADPEAMQDRFTDGFKLTLNFREATVGPEIVRDILREAGEKADGAEIVPSGSWNPDDPEGTIRTWTIYLESVRGRDQIRDTVARSVEAIDGVHLTDPVPAKTVIGSAEAETISNQAFIALLLSLIAQILYIAFRFRGFSFGFAAVIALVHDVSVTLGVVALVDMFGIVDVKINLPILAAFLTLIGYSMNDTIVVFDRIRENRKRWKGTFSDLIDVSVNQNLARTLRTSFTTFLVLAVIFIVNRGAASVLEGFSFVMLAGVVTGTYSSIFIASPMLMFLPWYWRGFKEIFIRNLWTKAGPAKIVTWALVLAAFLLTPLWIVIGLVKWITIPDADRALNLALRAEGENG